MLTSKMRNKSQEGDHLTYNSSYLRIANFPI